MTFESQMFFSEKDSTSEKFIAFVFGLLMMRYLSVIVRKGWRINLSFSIVYAITMVQKPKKRMLTQPAIHPSMLLWMWMMKMPPQTRRMLAVMRQSILHAE